MMKKYLIIFGAIVSFNANAASWYIPNSAGGQIVITDEECWVKEKKYDSLHRAYARLPTGETFSGCWYYSDTIVRIVYENGQERTHLINDFRKVE